MFNIDIKFNLFDDDFWERFWEKYRENFRKSLVMTSRFEYKVPDIKIKVPSLKFQVPDIKIANFKTNLFSEKMLEHFNEISNFPKKDILEMNYAFRYSNINFAPSSTFTETVDSSHPIDREQQERNDDRSKRMFNVNHVLTSSITFAKTTSVGISGSAIWDFLVKLAYNEPINTPFYIWVLFLSYFCFLLINDPGKND